VSDLEIALALADAADPVTLARYRAGDLVIDTKPDLTPVTESDRGVERLARAMLRTSRPGDAILGEEFGGVIEGGRTWIIDPIDGTKNYVRGVPVWATLIALVEDGRALVGVVSAPALGRRWWAAAGAGAWTTGPESREARTLTCSRVTDLADASLSVSDHVGWPDDSCARLQRAVWRSRAYGDFWSHMLVAEGAVDIAGEPELNAWDVAALLPIVSEAGGRMTRMDGTPLDLSAAGLLPLLTTNGLLHDQAVEVITATR
jgi:histidinol-phosphatase